MLAITFVIQALLSCFNCSYSKDTIVIVWTSTWWIVSDSRFGPSACRCCVMVYAQPHVRRQWHNSDFERVYHVTLIGQSHNHTPQNYVLHAACVLSCYVTIGTLALATCTCVLSPLTYVLACYSSTILPPLHPFHSCSNICTQAKRSIMTTFEHVSNVNV